MPTIKLTFDTIRQLLKDAVNDQDFAEKNTILSDNVTKTELLDRIESFRQDFSVSLSQRDAHEVSGNVTIDEAARTIHVASGDPAPAENTCIFGLFQTLAPVSLTGWSFTVQDAGGGVDLFDFSVFYREVDDPDALEVDYPWHRLDMDDRTEVIGQVAELQVKVVVATLTSPLDIRNIVILAHYA